MANPVASPVATPVALTEIQAPAKTQPGAPQTRLSDSEIRSIVFGLMTAMLLAALDQTIVATAMPTIGRDLGDAANLPWIVTAYLLASTAVTPLYGKLSDIHGRRIMLLIAIATFVVGSLACALAPTMVTLALARGLQGIGGGGLIALAQTIMADIVAPKERARYQVGDRGRVRGRLGWRARCSGGFFAEHLHWSLIFWINLPLGILAFALTNANLKRLPRHDRQHRLDCPGRRPDGRGLDRPAAGPELGRRALPLELRAGPGPPRPGGVAGGRLRGAARHGGRAADPHRGAQEPSGLQRDAGRLLRHGHLHRADHLRADLPRRGDRPLGERVRRGAVPLMIGTVTGATLSGRSMIHFRHYKRVPLAMMSVSLACCAVIAWQGRALPFWLMELLFALLSMGIGTILPLSTIAIQNAVARPQLGIATASMNFFRSLGGALIVAAFGTIVLGGAADGTGGHDVESLIRGADPAQLALTFRYVFAAACLGLLAAFAFLALMEERPLGERSSPRMDGGTPDKPA